MDIEAAVVLLVVTLLVISAAAVLAPRLKIAAPLILVLAGIGVSLVPSMPEIVIDPHIILLVLLPPLLYASATAVPAMNFRRDLRAINGLSVVLVILSSLALGALFHRLIPGLDFAWGVALGAVLSPTDAVATAIVKARGVPGRVAVILDGEGLLNDASAIVLLRTAIASAAVGFAFWPTAGMFLYSVVVAIVLGFLAAKLNLAVRSRVKDEAVNTILSFTTPFIAAVPAELLGASGLVAAVAAGLVTGIRRHRVLPPGHRLSDFQNWATVEVVLEGLIFLTMGLQLATIVRQVGVEPNGIARGLGLAAIALVAVMIIRAAYVGLLLSGLRRRGERRQPAEPEVARMREQLEAGRVRHIEALRDGEGWRYEGARLFRRIAVQLADIEYLERHPIGKAETAIIIWAGMRGAVTVAAVQLLPETTPHRPLLVFIAFSVATMSLLIQGGTIGILASRLFPPEKAAATAATLESERRRIGNMFANVEGIVKRSAETSDHEHRLALLKAKRNALLDASDHGVFEADAVRAVLLDLDIDQLALELRSEPAG